MIAVLYGRMDDEPGYMEQVLIETKNLKALDLARKTYTTLGYVGLRTMYYDDIPQKPDFVRSINI